MDNLLVRVHFIIVTIRWTGLAPYEPEFLFPGSPTFTFLETTINPRNSRCTHVNGPLAHPAALYRGTSLIRNTLILRL